MSSNIWIDDDGKEVKRETKGRGRPLRGFVKGQDGNWYSNPDKMPVPVADPSSSVSTEPASAKTASAKTASSSSSSSSGNVFLIWIDDDGNETKREPKTRGRPPRDFQKKEDGNWYYIPPWKAKVEEEAKTEANDNTEEVVEEVVRPKLRRMQSENKTTVEKIARALNVTSHEQRGNTIIFFNPVRIGETGLLELDIIHGQPVFFKIEVDEQSRTVAVWTITSPGGPSMIFEDVLENPQ